MRGRIYTETTIHAAPRQFERDAPYQLVIVQLDDGVRVTGRVTGSPVRIDDAVELADEKDGVPFFRKL